MANRSRFQLIDGGGESTDGARGGYMKDPRILEAMKRREAEIDALVQEGKLVEIPGKPGHYVSASGVRVENGVDTNHPLG